MTGIYDAFAAEFGADQADAIVAAAESHRNGIHDNPGSDPFKWALCIAIGFDCMEAEGYRRTHGITAPFADLKHWVYDHADLASHDGDVDFLAMLVGKYADGWVQYDDETPAVDS